jgi:hypothetical protein
MKTNIIFTVLFVSLVLASCAPAVTVVPTETATPTSTSSPTPTAKPAPTNTPTPAPENIADVKDLSVWVDEFVHAYGGKVVVDGVEMDASQLTHELREKGDKYLQLKKFNGAEILFLVVNEIPLAIREEDGTWQPATMAKLGELNGVEFECSLRLDPRKYQEFLRISEMTLGNSPVVVFTTQLDVTTVFGDFTEADWQNVLDNWNGIQSDFASGIVPAGYPYYWKSGIDGMDADVIRAFGGNPQFRSQQLYEGGLRPDGNRIEPLRMFQTQKSQEEMLKIFEFVVRTRVLQFPEIKRWDVSDEVSGAYVQYLYNNVTEVNFWGLSTGLKPSELTLRVAGWVKEDNPEAMTYVNEANIFDSSNPIAKDELDYFYGEYISEIIASNDNRSIDGVVGQNNWWIYEPQDWQIISERMDFLQENGLKIGGSETMIVSGDVPINDCCGRRKLIEIEDPRLAQAEMFAQWLDLYLDKGVTTIGFGNIDDFYAWTQDSGLPDANPTLFDIDFRAKPAYYAIVQVLYEHIP